MNDPASSPSENSSSTSTALLTTREVATSTGLGEPTVRALAKRGHFPGARKNEAGNWEYPREGVESWLGTSLTELHNKPSQLTQIWLRLQNWRGYKLSEYVSVVLSGLGGLATLVLLVFTVFGWPSGSEDGQQPLPSQPPMSGDLNVIVAPFSDLTDDSAADELIALSQDFADEYSQFLESASSFSPSLRGPAGQVPNTEDDTERRAEHYQNVLTDNSADVLISGFLYAGDKGTIYFQPEFQISAEAFLGEAGELSNEYGYEAFGSPIPLADHPNRDRVVASLLRSELVERATIIAQFSEGLYRYKKEEYSIAKEIFDRLAVNTEVSSVLEIPELFYLFAGNSALRSEPPDLATAEDSFLSAIAKNDMYARAQLGLAEAKMLDLMGCLPSNENKTGCCSSGWTVATADVYQNFSTARDMIDRADSADIALKATLQQARVLACLSINGTDAIPELNITDTGRFADEQLMRVVTDYEQRIGARKSRVVDLAAEAHSLLGRLSIDAGETEIAAGHFSEAARLSRRPGRIAVFRATLAWMAAGDGRCDEARSEWGESQSFLSESEETEWNLSTTKREIVERCGPL